MYFLLQSFININLNYDKSVIHFQHLSKEKLGGIFFIFLYLN